MPRTTPMSNSDGATAEDGVMREQRDANEQLVLATLHAQEEADTARGAQRSAEQVVIDGQEREEKLRIVGEFRERLIGIVGHDLRNPLNAMLMASGLLIARGNLDDTDARLVNRIVNSGQRMTRMINQLLEFTRARLGGGVTLDLARVDLGEICRNITDELRVGSDVDIRVTLAGDLVGSWDGDRLAEVLSNITGNAIGHATAGTPVLVHVHEDGDSVVGEISNQGIDIPPHILPSIFDAFARAPSQGAAGHLGLGLYISSEIIRSHGGTLAVRSANGTTTFAMTLPRAVPCAPGSQQHAA